MLQPPVPDITEVTQDRKKDRINSKERDTITVSLRNLEQLSVTFLEKLILNLYLLGLFPIKCTIYSIKYVSVSRMMKAK